MKRVVITGMGAITPIGLNVEDFWSSVKSQTIGIGPITYFDTTDYKAKLAAEVKGFVAKERLDAKKARRMEPFTQYAVAAAQEAIEDAKLDMEKEDPYRVGVSVGSGCGSLPLMEKQIGVLNEKGPSRVAPLFIPMFISNMAAGNISIYFGLKGKSIDIVTACATGTHSIGEAYRTIQCGDADVMVAGGTEACICPIGVAGFTALTALTTADDPKRASIPFDKDRSGFVMGEGAAIVVLESLEHAQARGAKIYAEVSGYGATSDAYHVTSPAEDGMGAATAMMNAMKEAGVKAEEVDYINAHGTSTHLNDAGETKAIKAAFGEHAYKLMVSSTKSMTGHLLGASGAVEAIFTTLALKDGFIPATIHYQVPDEECDLDIVPNEGRNVQVEMALSKSLGFGGHNASVLFKRYQEA